MRLRIRWGAQAIRRVNESHTDVPTRFDSSRKPNFRPPVNHPELLRPETLAQFNTGKMGKSTIFMSERMLVGLNAFEPGQEHALHGHKNQDKVYHVLQGKGLFLLEDKDIEMDAGAMLVAPAGVPHGVRNTGGDRLVVLVFMAPSPV